MVRVGGMAGRPADMAKSSEWRSNFGRFWLRRGTDFAGLDGCKDCAMPGTETGESNGPRRQPGCLKMNSAPVELKDGHSKTVRLYGFLGACGIRR
jgi:hypothetical protein